MAKAIEVTSPATKPPSAAATILAKLAIQAIQSPPGTSAVIAYPAEVRRLIRGLNTGLRRETWSVF